MAIKVYQVTLGSGATPIIDPTVNPAHKTPVQEIHLNPTTAAYYFGGPDVSTTKYVRTVQAVGTSTAVAIVGNGPAAIAIDVLENLYLVGTQGNVVNVGVVTL